MGSWRYGVSVRWESHHALIVSDRELRGFKQNLIYFWRVVRGARCCWNNFFRSSWHDVGGTLVHHNLLYLMLARTWSGWNILLLLWATFGSKSKQISIRITHLKVADFVLTMSVALSGW